MSYRVLGLCVLALAVPGCISVQDACFDKGARWCEGNTAVTCRMQGLTLNPRRFEYDCSADGQVCMPLAHPEEAGKPWAGCVRE